MLFRTRIASKIAEQEKGKLSVVSEMIDVRNRELAEVTRADDFVVSNRLVSLMLSQVSENPDLNAVFAYLQSLPPIPNEVPQPLPPLQQASK